MERPNFEGLAVSFRECRTADGFRPGNSGEKLHWEGPSKKSAEIGPCFDHQHLFPICVTYGRMQLTRAKRDASNPMHLRSHWHGDGMFWELERMDEMK